MCRVREREQQPLRIAITGANGFVGRALVQMLVQRGHSVKRLLRRPYPDPDPERIESVVGSLSDDHALAELCAGADAVCHLVAVIRERGPSTFHSVNVVGTQRVLAAAKTAGVDRVIHLSALGGDPASPYAYLRSKGLGEEAVKSSGLSFTILRASVIYGPDDEFINLLGAVALALPVVPIVGAGGNLFQPISLRNVCEVVCQCLEHEEHHRRTYELGGPDQLRYDDIVRAIAAEMGLRRLYIRLPIGIMTPAAHLMNRLLPHPPVTTGQLDLLGVDNVAADNAAESVFALDLDRLVDNLGYVRSITLPAAIGAVLGVRRLR